MGCQLADEFGLNDDEEGYISPPEIFFYPPTDDENNDKKELCQQLFDSLSKLINLNPIMDDEDDGAGMGGLAAMLAMAANSSRNDDEDDDMICRIDASQMVTAWDDKSQEDEGAPSNERSQMLERLANMLVVPPEYEVDGQFDDADEDDRNVSEEQSGVNGDAEMDNDIL